MALPAPTARAAPGAAGARARLLPARQRPQSGQVVLEVDAIRKEFGGLVAVNDISFKVSSGEIMGLIGPNGAGKSTTFNLISGVLPVTRGQVRFMGERIDNRSAREIAKLGVGRTFQHVQLLPGMTVLESVALGAHLRSDVGVLAGALHSDRAREAQLLHEAAEQVKRVGLGEYLYEQAGNLALGQQRILEIARALAADPVLLLLDEPAAGLRYKEKQDLARVLEQLRAEGMSILLVEHDMDFVMRLTNHLVVMDFGTKLAEGVPAECSRTRRCWKPTWAASTTTCPRPTRPSPLPPEVCNERATETSAGSQQPVGPLRQGRRAGRRHADRAGRQHRHRDRRQRRRQIHHVERGDGFAAAHRPCRRRGALLGHRRVGLAGRAPRGRGHVSGAGTPRAVRHHVGRGQSVAGWFPPLSRARERLARHAERSVRPVPRLRERRAQQAGTLSGGERQMLAVGRALMAKPQLLMLDEPSLGLAPRIVREIFHIIARLRETGVAILLVEQNARAALQVADYGYVLETGEVTLHGPARELAGDPKVIESYLGLGKGGDKSEG